MKFSIEKNEDNKIKLELEEYIPLKIICSGEEEPVNFFSYSKDKTSLLEIAVGVYSGLIKKITLLLSKDYVIFQSKMIIDEINYEYGIIKFEEYDVVECGKFTTYLFNDGIKIVLSNENSAKYIIIDTLYIGLSNSSEITEICMTQLNVEEIRFIKNELEFQ
jgi:hypothetical protein